jgi:hypothetical protein
MRKVIVFFVFGCLHFVCSAQSTQRIAGPCPGVLEEKVQRANGLVTADLTGFLTFSAGAECMSALLLSQSTDLREVLVDRAETVKAALQQNSSSAGSGGATSLVSKGTAAQFLSIASEYGALTEVTNKQTVTVSGSLGGIPSALVKNGIMSSCGGIVIPGSVCISSNTVNALNRVSYSVAFNTGSSAQSISARTTSTSSSSAQPASFTASTNTVSSATGRVVLLRGAAATIADTVKAIDKLRPGGISSLTGEQIKAGEKYIEAVDNYDDKSAVRQWRDNTAAKMIAAGPQGALDVWLSSAGALVDAICPLSAPATEVCRGNLLKDVEQYASFVNAYKASVNLFVEKLRKAPLLSFEYDYNRPASEPTNSTFRLVGQSIFGGATATLNTAASIYNAAPSSSIPGASRLRDIQAAAEMAYDFSKAKRSNILGHSTASVAYYFQDQTSPAILNVTPGQPVSGIIITGLPSSAKQLYAQKGDISIAQGKFTYTPGASSISLPISVTWSNRTELVTNSIWRGQVGISYDFDSLFGSKK